MSQSSFPSIWPRPDLQQFDGQYVSIARLNAADDLADLYALSHGSAEYEALWTYMPQSPFANPAAMGAWLKSIEGSLDPLFYTVTSKALQRKVGMIAIMNIAPEAGRAELGNIWYSPLVQKTRVNTEVTYLFLRYLFDELHYRRVEWKCNNLNAPSKRTALRMGFKYEGLFRQHMIVKGLNRDTAWYSIIDSEWPSVKANFETYLSAANVSLYQLNHPEKVAALYHNSDAVEQLVQGFRDCTLPCAQWTHHAHLTVAAWFLLRYDDAAALTKIRDGIQAYNAACGVPTTPTRGYHETLTRFYVWAVRQFLNHSNTQRPIHSIVNDLIAAYGDKSWPLQYYSRNRLFSPEARFGWLEPDLKPMQEI